MSIEEKKKTIKDFMRAMGTSDLELYEACITPDCIVWTSGNAWYAGDHDMEKLKADTFKAIQLFPNGIQFTIHNMIGEGDQVAVEATSHGDHISGRTYSNMYHLLFKFRGDRIEHYKEYMDTELAISFLGKEKPWQPE